MPTQISRNRGVFQTFMVNSPSPLAIVKIKMVGITDKNYSKGPRFHLARAIASGCLILWSKIVAAQRRSDPCTAHSCRRN